MLDTNGFYRHIAIPAIDDGMIDALHDIVLRDTTDDRFDWREPPEHFTNVVGKFQRLDDLAASCTIACVIRNTVSIPPDTILHTHLDLWPESRKSLILIPLLPRVGISPTFWYETQQSSNPIVIQDWQWGQPALMNVRNRWHSVENRGDRWRSTLQIMLDADYDTVVDLIRDNRLFDGYDCVFSR